MKLETRKETIHKRLKSLILQRDKAISRFKILSDYSFQLKEDTIQANREKESLIATVSKYEEELKTLE